jgi:hypothetical protein
METVPIRVLRPVKIPSFCSSLDFVAPVGITEGKITTSITNPRNTTSTAPAFQINRLDRGRLVG